MNMLASRGTETLMSNQCGKHQDFNADVCVVSIKPVPDIGSRAGNRGTGCVLWKNFGS